MAELAYGAEGTPIYIPEHLLAHVKVVVTTKLRRHESFMMSWRHTDGSGRSSVWLEQSIPLRFTFESVDEPRIDPALLSRLAAGANSNAGLILELDEIHPLGPPATASPALEKSVA
ncbi:MULTISPECIES: hypothetical protein [Microbacterium]|uniref:DUF7882 domain-containing protein n=1 Tax=Microbacterium trichothecenolyticum TaxID=69370 RepID=A0A0M2HKG0_MICTR|nr:MULTISPECIES: hypothetical protein [Microbacterium]KJL44866.1 hypothetical protein RS82_00589 [Microbacterium trichothecenolyticum]MDR7190773.1 hypothetical protein [Microbacterium sp. BE35]